MTQPTVITANSISYEPTANSGTTRTFSNVSIPANCNTFMVLIVLSGAESSANWTDVTFNGVGAVKLHQIDVSASSTIRATIAAVFDTSNIGAVTGDIIGTLDTSVTFRGMLGVVCTTGFLENFSASQDRSANIGRTTVWSPNYDNNIQVLMGGQDRDADLFSVSEGVELYADDPAGFADPVAWAAYQTTNQANNQKSIRYYAASEEIAEMCYLISSQRNPYGALATQTGTVIKHNVIT